MPKFNNILPIVDKSQIKKSITEASRKLQKANDSLSKAIKDNESSLAEIKATVGSKTKELDKYVRDTNVAKKTSEKAQKLLSDLKSKVLNTTSTLKSVTSDIEKSKKVIEKLKLDKQVLEDSVKELKQQKVSFGDISSQVTASLKEKTELQSVIQALSAEKDRLLITLKDAKLSADKEMNQIRGDLMKAGRNIKSKMADLENIEAQIERGYKNL